MLGNRSRAESAEESEEPTWKIALSSKSCASPEAMPSWVICQIEPRPIEAQGAAPDTEFSAQAVCQRKGREVCREHFDMRQTGNLTSKLPSVHSMVRVGATGNDNHCQPSFGREQEVA
ncbi:hypothetical protein PlfCFBP13513_17035 [Plantibacter flavus]|nr:hypothetical protein PlfCFBP13513_17035 [Plantibacter flavus]